MPPTANNSGVGISFTAHKAEVTACGQLNATPPFLICSSVNSELLNPLAEPSQPRNHY